jgi:hypothetical protein
VASTAICAAGDSRAARSMACDTLDYSATTAAKYSAGIGHPRGLRVVAVTERSPRRAAADAALAMKAGDEDEWHRP